jgi:hypothetical protein
MHISLIKKSPIVTLHGMDSQFENSTKETILSISEVPFFPKLRINLMSQSQNIFNKRSFTVQLSNGDPILDIDAIARITEKLDFCEQLHQKKHQTHLNLQEWANDLEESNKQSQEEIARFLKEVHELCDRANSGFERTRWLVEECRKAREASFIESCVPDMAWFISFIKQNIQYAFTRVKMVFYAK